MKLLVLEAATVKRIEAVKPEDQDWHAWARESLESSLKTAERRRPDRRENHTSRKVYVLIGEHRYQQLREASGLDSNNKFVPVLAKALQTCSNSDSFPLLLRGPQIAKRICDDEAEYELIED